MDGARANTPALGAAPSRLVLAWLAVSLLAGCGPSAPPEQSEAFQRATHRGAAQLENRVAAEAVAAFARAAELAPDSALAQRNLARGHLLARDGDAALAALGRARALDPQSAAAAYLSGIAHARESRFEEAIPLLEEAARLDPATAAIRFQLAGAYQAVGRHDDAVAQLRETVRLEPLHVAAHYRLAGEARRRGDDDELARARSEIARLMRVLGEEDRSPEALEVCIHTRAEMPPTPAAPLPAPAPTTTVRFEPADDAAPDLRDAVAVAVLELDAGGRYTLVALDGDGRLSLHHPAHAGTVPPAAALAEVPETIRRTAPLRLVVGNFHDDVPAGEPYDPERHARNDVLVLSPGGALLLERRADGRLEDVTEQAGLASLSGRVARWLDYDHDGDLDLVTGGDAGVRLWQNGGDARFEEVGAQVGLVHAAAVNDLAAVDLSTDGAVDVVVAGGESATRVLEGRRTGRFARQLEPPGPWPPARRVLVDELDGDGAPDVLLVGEHGVSLMPAAGGPARALAPDTAGAGGPTAAALLDHDNDGRLDVLVAERGGSTGGARLRLWRHDASGAWQEVSEATGLGESALPEVLEAVAVDLDADGDGDLLLTTAEGVRVLRNVGGDAAGQLKLRLHGTKSNPSAYGVRVTARAPGLRVTRFVQDVPVELGLAGRTQLDSLQTLWTNGVVDNQIDLSPGPDPVTIVEQNVAAGSCPYLYAWDGQGFRFVTDLLGNAPIGLSARRGVPLPADPDELVRVGRASSLPRRDGAYVLQVTDELREVVYLDQARLWAVDHPAEVEVHPTDRLAGPPFPPSEVWALAQIRTPLQARGDDGVDRTLDVAAIDQRFAPPGRPRPPPLRGQTEPLVLELDFGPLADFAQPVLALTGWLQYGDASRNIALSQNRSVEVVPPTLEMETEQGDWRRVDVEVGMPAGKTKTILVDLAGRLAPGARRLRLRTTFELRWDRIALGERLPDSVLHTHVLAPSRAELAPRGFSEIRARAPGHPTTPRHAALLATPPWQTTPVGFVTRFGDVSELVAERDEWLVVMNGGDALELAFADPLPEPAEGRLLTFFFYSVGWDKDEDHNVIEGTTVEPLPVSAAAADQRERYHTRFVPRDAPLRAARPER